MVVRLFNTVGPRPEAPPGGMVIPDWSARPHPAHRCRCTATAPDRCFCHVADVVTALVALLDRDEAVGEVFNVGATGEVSIATLRNASSPPARAPRPSARPLRAGLQSRGSRTWPAGCPTRPSCTPSAGGCRTGRWPTSLREMIDEAALGGARPGMRAAVLVADGVSARNFLLGDLGPPAPPRPVDRDPRPAGVVRQAGSARGPARQSSSRSARTYQAALPMLLRYTLLYGQMEFSDTTSMRHNLARPVTGSARHRALHHHRPARRAPSQPGPAAWPPWTRRTPASSRGVPRSPPPRRARRGHARRAVLHHQRPRRSLPRCSPPARWGSPPPRSCSAGTTCPARGASRSRSTTTWCGAGNIMTTSGASTGSPTRRSTSSVPPSSTPTPTSRGRGARAELCDRLGLDPGRPICCFSGGDPGNSRRIPTTSPVLCGLVAPARVPCDLQVVVAPAPVDDGTLLYDRVRRVPELCWVPAEWHRPPGATGPRPAQPGRRRPAGQPHPSLRRGREPGVDHDPRLRPATARW